MDIILEQYFDVGLMIDEFDPVLKGFEQTLLLSAFGGVPFASKRETRVPLGMSPFSGCGT